MRTAQGKEQVQISILLTVAKKEIIEKNDPFGKKIHT